MRRPSGTPLSGPDRDAGRVSVFIAITFTGLLMVFGVAVDATGQLRTLMRADNLAAEAARSAGQAIDVDMVAATGQHRVDPVLAAQYAETYLAAAGHGDESTVTLHDETDETTVDITVNLTYENRVLGMFGRSDVVVTGTATAVLVSGP